MPQTSEDEFRRVIMRGIEYPWKEKEPFVDSGMSVHAGLEVHPESGKLKCHECGEWRDSLANHIGRHGISAREYKIRHGLRMKTPLKSPQLRRRSKPASFTASTGEAFRFRKGEARPAPSSPHPVNFELRNERGSCMAQTIKKLGILSERLGKWPTKEDLVEARIPITPMMDLFGVGDLKSIWSTVDLAYGPDLRQASRMLGAEDFRREFFIDALQNFKPRYGRYPWRGDCGVLIPKRSSFDHLFGSFDEALKAAGIAKAARAASTKNRTPEQRIRNLKLKQNISQNAPSALC